MSNTVHKIIELAGCDSSLEGAINLAIATASTTLRNLEWFKVVDIRGNIADNRVKNFQVVLKVGFRVEDVGTATNIEHNIPHKQAILPGSPAKEEQAKFIAEGGNSQPLHKRER